MSDKMQVCAGCSRHVREGEAACPFCGAPCARDEVPWGRIGAGVMLAMAASAALHACYGTPCTPSDPTCGGPIDRDAQVDAQADGPTGG